MYANFVSELFDESQKRRIVRKMRNRLRPSHFFQLNDKQRAKYRPQRQSRRQCDVFQSRENQELSVHMTI